MRLGEADDRVVGLGDEGAARVVAKEVRAAGDARRLLGRCRRRGALREFGACGEGVAPHLVGGGEIIGAHLPERHGVISAGHHVTFGKARRRRSAARRRTSARAQTAPP